MLGSKIGNQVVNVYGTVTTGIIWKFLKYEDEKGNTQFSDTLNYCSFIIHDSWDRG